MQAAPSEKFRRRHLYIQVSLGKSGTFKMSEISLCIVERL